MSAEPEVLAIDQACGLPDGSRQWVDPADPRAHSAVMRDRMAKIAEFHHKRVDSAGGTWGDCNECGLQWPCPTYDWARETSDRDPNIDCWDRTDDEPAGAS